MKELKELDDCTKIPIGNPRFVGGGSNFANSSAQRKYRRDQYISVFSRGPVGRQNGRQFDSLRAEGKVS